MKFSISQTELANALGVVLKGASTRSTLPILAGIYMEASGDSVIFQTTDLELSIQYQCVALVEEEGCAVLPGKIVTDIVKNLPDAAVHVSTEGTVATITCDKSSISLNGLEPLDWPGFPHVETDQRISVPFEVFSSMAKKVASVVSRDETRPVLTGVLVSYEDGVMRMAATDSYRLAVTERTLDSKADSFTAVIAGSFVSDLASLPKSEEDISIALSENQIVVSYRGTSFVNRRIEGNYPNYKQLIPATYSVRAVVSASALSSAVKRAALLGHSGASVRFSVSAEAQAITVSTVVQDIGSTQELVPAVVEGESVEVGFNSAYVLEGINSAPSDQIALELLGAMKPGILRPVGTEGYLYLVMPVRL